MIYDETHADVGRFEYVVRDVDEPDLGIRDRNAPEMSLRARGFGSLKSEASDEIEARLDLEEYVGERVATVWIDVIEWDYRIYWHVEPPLTQRVSDLLGPFGGVAP